MLWGTYRGRFDNSRRFRPPKAWLGDPELLGPYAYEVGPTLVLRAEVRIPPSHPIRTHEGVRVRTLQDGRFSISNLLDRAVELQGVGILMVGQGSSLIITGDTPGWEERVAEAALADPIYREAWKE